MKSNRKSRSRRKCSKKYKSSSSKNKYRKYKKSFIKRLFGAPMPMRRVGGF